MRSEQPGPAALKLLDPSLVDVRGKVPPGQAADYRKGDNLTDHETPHQERSFLERGPPVHSLA